MKAHIVSRGPHKGWLRLTAEKDGKAYICESIQDNVLEDTRLAEMLEWYTCNGSFSLLTDADLGSLNEAGYTSIISSNIFIASESIISLTDDNGEMIEASDSHNLDTLEIKLWHYDWTHEMPTEAMLRQGYVDFKPLS